MLERSCYTFAISIKRKIKMPKKVKKTKKSAAAESNRLLAAASILFGGGAVILIGLVQNNDNIKLLLVGFGAAFLVLGGVLVGMSTKPLKK
jgi:hypothetical protein